VRVRLKRLLAWLIGLTLATGALAAVGLAVAGLPGLAAGMTAKAVCSAVFVPGRSPDGLLDQDVKPADLLLRPVRVSRGRVAVAQRHVPVRQFVQHHRRNEQREREQPERD
jgi:hypothetical protein